MSTLAKVVIISVLALAFPAGQIFAADLNPNGFPSGPHFNLNIIGKKEGFVCPPAQYDAYGNQIYGNVIFIPENGKDITILMESGTKGPKSSPAVTELQVTDWCSGFAENDTASLRLPKNDAGYRVFARALAKPTYEPTMVIDPAIVYAQDELGNYLYFLGTVGFNSFTTSYGVNTVYRTKGKSTAFDVTPLFEWTGEVCYLTPTTDPSYTVKPLCGLDTTIPPDGVYEEIVPPISVVDGVVTCPTGYVPLTGYCKTYTSEWVFNIADFVGYLWDIDNNGLKLLQVRFYPN